MSSSAQCHATTAYTLSTTHHTLINMHSHIHIHTQAHGNQPTIYFHTTKKQKQKQNHSLVYVQQNTDQNLHMETFYKTAATGGTSYTFKVAANEY